MVMSTLRITFTGMTPCSKPISTSLLGDKTGLPLDGNLKAGLMHEMELSKMNHQDSFFSYPLFSGSSDDILNQGLANTTTK